MFRRAVLLVAVAASAATAQSAAYRANWGLADKFSAANLRPIIYTSSITPRWLGQSDSLCYYWKDHSGSAFYIAVPTLKTKRPLFDQEKMAAQLSGLSHHAYDPNSLPFTTLTFTKDRKGFTFTADSARWEWTLATESLKRLGPAGGQGRGGQGGQAGADTAAGAAAADSLLTCGGGGGGRGGGGGGGGGQFGGGRGGGD